MLIPETIATTDSVTFSFVGFKPLKYKIANIEHSEKQIIYLQRASYNIEEVTVTAGKTKHLKIGWSSTGGRFLQHALFSQGEIKSGNRISREKGVILSSEYECKVNSLHFFYIEKSLLSTKKVDD